MNDLPDLKEKQNKCLIRYLTNGGNKSEAYRFAYDCENMSDAAVWVESNKFFKNPKIALWLEEYRNNTQTTIQEELKYSALEHFKELQTIQTLALVKFRDKQGNPNLSAAIKAVELKGKLAGLYKEAENQNNNNETINFMGNIVIDNEVKRYKVGNDNDTSEDS